MAFKYPRPPRAGLGTTTIFDLFDGEEEQDVENLFKQPAKVVKAKKPKDIFDLFCDN